MYRMPIPDSYCSAGVDADVVFFPYQSQYVPNVAGFGGDMGKDQYGRPVLITMGWGLGDEWGYNVTLPNTTDAVIMAQKNATARAIVLHELVHGLGFNIFQFQNSFDSRGDKKTLVLMGPVGDVDGAVDNIWQAVGQRTITVARAYFNCPTLLSLPLMGENPLGDTSRGSHWETRLLREEFKLTQIDFHGLKPVCSQPKPMS